MNKNCNSKEGAEEDKHDY